MTTKEFRSFFITPIGFIFIVVFLLVANFLFWNNFFLFNNASIRSYFMNIGLMLVFLTPAITMRAFAEEKRLGTEEILFTLPLTDWQIVLSKFAANLLFIGLALAITLTVPVSVSLIGRLDWGATIAGYLGMICFGAFAVAIGLYVSSLTKEQISSFLIALAVNFFLYLSGQDFLLERVPLALAPVVRFISPMVHADNFAKGMIDIRDFVYFVSFTAILLLTLVKNLTRRRYR